MPLNQQGADTITHIVSMGTLLALGLGVPMILALAGTIPNNVDTAQHAAILGAMFAFETVVAIEMGYYSTQYQKTPTGQITITTVSPDGISTQKASVPSNLVIIGPDGKPIPIPAGSTIQTG